MNVDLNKIDDLNGEITIQIAPEDYKSQYNASIEQYRKQAQFPGFRPGKVPVSLIKKKYGRSLLAEEINKLLNQKISEYITEEKLPVLGQPMPKPEADNGDWENPDNFSFTFQLGLAPDFELKLSKRDKLTWHKIAVDEKLVNQQAEDYTRRYGKLSEPEASEEKDMLVGDLVELDDKGEILEGGILANATVAIEHVPDAEEQKKLLGVKKEDSVVVNPKKIAKDDDDLMRLLNVEAEKLPGLSEHFRYNIKEVRRMIPAEMNQELFDKVFGEGKVTSEEEFKAEITNRIAAELEGESKKLFKKHMTDHFLGKLKLDLPDEFLKRWIKTSNEKPITDEQLENDYPHYADHLRWQLVENQIIEKNELKVEQEEVIEHAKNTLAKHFAMYGIQQSDEELTKAAANVLRDEKEARRLYDELYEEKIVNFVKDAVKLEEKEVSFDDFIAIAKGE